MNDLVILIIILVVGFLLTLPVFFMDPSKVGYPIALTLLATTLFYALRKHPFKECDPDDETCRITCSLHCQEDDEDCVPCFTREDCRDNYKPTRSECRAQYPVTKDEARELFPVSKDEARELYPVSKDEARTLFPVSRREARDLYPVTEQDCRMFERPLDKKLCLSCFEERKLQPFMDVECKQRHSCGESECQELYPWLFE